MGQSVTICLNNTDFVKKNCCLTAVFFYLNIIQQLKQSLYISYTLMQQSEKSKRRRTLYIECRIAGTGYRDLEDIWHELHAGAKLTLVREKRNKYDKNAVAIALADDNESNTDKSDSGIILGYVPRSNNQHLASMLDMGWKDAFECELSSIDGNNPNEGVLYTRIYIVSKYDSENRYDPLRLLELSDTGYENFTYTILSEGCVYFRWGGFPPWERNLPDEGDKVVFMHRNNSETILYLMYCIANGNEIADYIVKDKQNMPFPDDSSYYVFTNIKGPVKVKNDKIAFLNGENINKCQPETLLTDAETSELYRLLDEEN